MRPHRRPQGLAMVVCLLVLAIVLIFAQAMGTLGMHHLGVVRADYYDRVSAWAAEAGAARALHELGADSGWTAGFANESLTEYTRSAYTVQVTPGGSTAPDGTVVPSGHVYVLSTGTCLDGKYPRTTAVMLSSTFQVPYVLASGGNMKLGGAARITGSVRAGGDIEVNGSVQIEPDSSGGRVLAGGHIDIGSNITLDSTQDIRAREEIEEVSDVKGTTAIYAFDQTSDTDPFDDTGPLPKPDRAALLAGAVTHTETRYRSGETLDLNGQVHYFPDGVEFTNGASITGMGTIVVGGGNAAKFGIPLNEMDMNVVALDSGDGEVGDALISFTRNTSLNGLVFSEGNVTSSASLEVDGAIIAWGINGDVEQLDSRAATKLTRAAPVAPLPGFEAYSGGGNGSSGLTIESWQRL